MPTATDIGAQVAAEQAAREDAESGDTQGGKALMAAQVT